jgi:FlaA1/EpsC-like NDP-sugar epimerase
VRNRYVLLGDLAAVVLCILGAFVLRLDWFFTQSPEYTLAFRYYLTVALVTKPIIYFFFGLYHRYWRYAGVNDLLVVLLAVSASSVVTAVLVTIGVQAGLIPVFPRSILALDWLLSLACVGGLRMSVRLVSESFRGRKTPGNVEIRRVLIAGAGDAGALVVREMQKNPQIAMQPVGFLDDQPAKQGKHIHGLKVLGPLERIEDILAAHAIDEVVVAMPTAPGSALRRVHQACQRAGVPSRAVPGVFELLEGAVTLSRLREIDIADLLRRAQIRARPEAGFYLQGRVVLVTGAGGSIGSELCRQVAHARAREIVLLGHGENSIFDAAAKLAQSYPAVRLRSVIADVRDDRRIAAILEEHRPSIVFHAAAHKHVPLMEAHPAEAVTNNVLGTRTMVEAAIAAEVERFVLISTDKAVAPTSVMGATKRVAEMVVAQAARRTGKPFAAVRFGNVLGSRGSVVPSFKSQIDRGGPVTVTHPDVRRFFMTIPEAVYLVIKAGGRSRGGELFVLNMGDPVKIVDLAHDLIRLSGFSVDAIPIVYTGLRQGEKLDERLWETGSQVEEAGDAEVFTVVEPDGGHERAALDHRVDSLIAAATRGDGLAVHHLLSELIPTFVSSLHEGSPSGSRVQ